ncbi:hypothetical protein OPQ81_008060 [Rhizoctonia solani]|nr:hypothetical protein OPQ81_008060 [Rhizoctonia solani]
MVSIHWAAWPEANLASPVCGGDADEGLAVEEVGIPLGVGIRLALGSGLQEDAGVFAGVGKTAEESTSQTVPAAVMSHIKVQTALEAAHVLVNITSEASVRDCDESEA